MNAHSDMSSVIEPKSDQINADSLLAGPQTFTIKGVRITPGTEQPVSMELDGTDLVYRPCKSMSRVMVQAWGPDAKQYVGRSLTLYRDPEVKWGGMAVGGIRISHLSHIDEAKHMVLTATKGSRKPFRVLPLVVDAGESGPTQADALDELERAAAQGTDALQTAWRLRWMAPHREALQSDLDRLKPIAAANDKSAAGPDEGPDRGEDDAADTNTNDESPAEVKARDVLDALAEAKDEAAIDSIVADYKPHEEAVPQMLRMKIEIAISDARQRAKVAA